MTAYYNEIDPFAAQWLRNLINAGHIAPGIVDERSIEDVYPSDLRGFTQCHFFAGFGAQIQGGDPAVLIRVGATSGGIASGSLSSLYAIAAGGLRRDRQK